MLSYSMPRLKPEWQEKLQDVKSISSPDGAALGKATRRSSRFQDSELRILDRWSRKAINGASDLMEHPSMDPRQSRTHI